MLRGDPRHAGETSRKGRLFLLHRRRWPRDVCHQSYLDIKLSYIVFAAFSLVRRYCIFLGAGAFGACTARGRVNRAVRPSPVAVVDAAGTCRATLAVDGRGPPIAKQVDANSRCRVSRLRTGSSPGRDEPTEARSRLGRAALPPRDRARSPVREYRGVAKYQRCAWKVLTATLRQNTSVATKKCRNMCKRLNLTLLRRRRHAVSR